MSIETCIHAAPKAELHLHLEGAIQPSTLLILAPRHGIDLPVSTVEGLSRWFVYQDFEHFRTVIRTWSSCLTTSDEYELVVHELGRELAWQNVRYAEVAFGPTNPYFRGIPQQVYMDGLNRGRLSARDEFGVEMNWVFELGRGPDQGPKTWDYTTQTAIEGRAEGVVSLGLSGPEYRHPTAAFAPWFERARAAGLHSRPHARELAGPSSIWDAIRELGAERIGHGVRAIEDPPLVSYLAEHALPLELCPTSNVCLGVYHALEEHPLPVLYQSGVILTVNSDDPSLFGATLTDELLTLVDSFGLNVGDIDMLLLAAVRSSFLEPEQKARLEADMRMEMDELKAIHLE